MCALCSKLITVKGVTSRPAVSIPVSRSRSSSNCSSWGLLPPVLLLQTVPPIQDCLEIHHQVVLQFAKLCPEVTIFFTLSSYNVTFHFPLRSTETHPISLFILLTMREVACKKHWDQIVFETNFYIVLYSVFVYMVSCDILLLLFTSHHLPIVRFFPCSKLDRQWQLEFCKFFFVNISFITVFYF